MVFCKVGIFRSNKFKIIIIQLHLSSFYPSKGAHCLLLSQFASHTDKVTIESFSVSSRLGGHHLLQFGWKLELLSRKSQLEYIIAMFSETRYDLKLLCFEMREREEEEQQNTGHFSVTVLGFRGIDGEKGVTCSFSEAVIKMWKLSIYVWCSG